MLFFILTFSKISKRCCSCKSSYPTFPILYGTPQIFKHFKTLRVKGLGKINPQYYNAENEFDFWNILGLLFSFIVLSADCLKHLRQGEEKNSKKKKKKITHLYTWHRFKIEIHLLLKYSIQIGMLKFMNILITKLKWLALLELVKGTIWEFNTNRVCHV